MAPDASQFSGGRRVTTGATGEATYNRKTDGEEARGGALGDGALRIFWSLSSRLVAMRRPGCPTSAARVPSRFVRCPRETAPPALIVIPSARRQSSLSIGPAAIAW